MAVDFLEQKTSDTEDFEVAIQMLNMFMKSYPENMSKYLNDIFDCLNIMIIKIKNKDIQC